MIDMATRKPSQMEDEDEPRTKRIVRLLSAQYYDVGLNHLNERVTLVKTAQQGEEVELVSGEERRLDSLGALMPVGATAAEAKEHQMALSDAYRAARGDQEALARHTQRLANQAPPNIVANDDGTDLVRIDAPVDEGAGPLSQWIVEKTPTSEEVIALAEDDPQLAKVVLEAETLATGGSPRPEVVAALEAIATA